ncbi:O-antigen/teichoic acid export membrane protein [Pseudomonas sp. SJZ079]|uniref:oligosaccharide flippase family protein n=1 Tax=Pseudomonas sp. SJZ079 TaxID=2572887 RepID=UPI00119B288F|nr:oligosaccharide flippase family protein [Pseudomonas sp. SJZ079]TWC34978.1 O-antigen/teichoic acid export membrane protein [Pseudomonas sp. SJZ079]
MKDNISVGSCDTSGAVKSSIIVRLLRGGKWAFIFRFMTSIIGFLISVLLTRVLPISDVGQYFLALSAVSILSVVALFGVNFSAVKLVAESVELGAQEQLKGIFLGCAAIVFFAAGLVALLFYVVLNTLPLDLGGLNYLRGEKATLIAIWMCLFSIQLFFAEFFRGLQDVFRASIFSGFLSGMLSLLILFFCWLTGFSCSLESVVLIIIISNFVACIIPGYELLSRFWSASFCIPWRKIVIVSMPLWITNLMLVVLLQADIWILSFYADGAAVALYGAASRFTQFLTLPLMVVNMALMPIISELYVRGDVSRLENILRATASVAFLPALFVIVAFLFVGRDVLDFVYGPGYVDAYYVLLILSAGQLVSVACGSAGYALMMTSKQRAMMWITISCGALSVTLSLLLVSNYSALGVAIASAFGLSLQGVLMLFWVKSGIGIWTFPVVGLLFRPRRILSYFD